MINKIYTHIANNLLTKLILSLIKFGITIITTRYLGADGRGIYVLINQIAGFANTLIGLSSGEGLTYYASKNKSFRNKLFYITLFLIFIFSIITISILIFLNYTINIENINKLSLNYKIILLSLILPFLTEYFVSFALRGLKLFKELNNVSLITRSITFIFLNLTFFFDNNKIEICLFLYLLSYLINCLIYVFYLNKITLKKNFFKIKDSLKVIKYSLPNHMVNLINELEYKIDTFIILILLDFKAIGIYSIAVAASQLIFYVSNSINTIIFSYLSSKNKKDYDIEIMSKMITGSFVCSFLILLPILIFGWLIFPLVFGEEFLSSYYIFVILSLATLCDSVTRVIISWFKGKNKASELINISVFCVTVNIVLNLILIPIINLYGAALASAISYFIRSVYVFIKFKKYNQVGLLQIFNFKVFLYNLKYLAKK